MQIFIIWTTQLGLWCKDFLAPLKDFSTSHWIVPSILIQLILSLGLWIVFSYFPKRWSKRSFINIWTIYFKYINILILDFMVPIIHQHSLPILRSSTRPAILRVMLLIWERLHRTTHFIRTLALRVNGDRQWRPLIGIIQMQALAFLWPIWQVAVSQIHIFMSNLFHLMWRSHIILGYPWLISIRHHILDRHQHQELKFKSIWMAIWVKWRAQEMCNVKSEMYWER